MGAQPLLDLITDVLPAPDVRGESLHVAGPSTGLWGRTLRPEERRESGIPSNALAVKVTFIWGAHTRRAGVKVNDIIVGIDGVRREGFGTPLAAAQLGP